MFVVPSVVRCRGVRENQVISDVVLDHAAYVERRRIEPLEDHRRIGAQIAKERDHRDTEDVIPKSPSIRPTAGHGSVTETRLNLTGQCISTKDAQPIKARTSS